MALTKGEKQARWRERNLDFSPSLTDLAAALGLESDHDP
jgi:hypothetical protein